MRVAQSVPPNFSGAASPVTPALEVCPRHSGGRRRFSSEAFMYANRKKPPPQPGRIVQNPVPPALEGIAFVGCAMREPNDRLRETASWFSWSHARAYHGLRISSEAGWRFMHRASRMKPSPQPGRIVQNPVTPALEGIAFAGCAMRDATDRFREKALGLHASCCASGLEIGHARNARTE